MTRSQVTDALLHWHVRRLKIAAINFLNPAPLMWDFEHEPGKSRLAERYSIHQTTPAGCADELVQGSADIGLVPVATYAFAPSLAVIPGCAIASLGDIRSIILVVKHADGVRGARKVALERNAGGQRPVEDRHLGDLALRVE